MTPTTENRRQARRWEQGQDAAAQNTADRLEEEAREDCGIWTVVEDRAGRLIVACVPVRSDRRPFKFAA